MNVLVIGGGGREHAICWKLKQSPKLAKLYCSPGNAGIAEIADTIQLDLNNFAAVAEFIKQQDVELTVIGPEQPLVEGLADFLRKKNMLVFGPGSDGAQLEGSKIFSKNLMQKYDIPTAAYSIFSDADKALKYLDDQPEGPIVVKADGLAAGKGAVVCQSIAEAKAVVREMMVDRVFADAGSKIVIEEFMTGEEASLFIITDGKNYLALPPAQDFKRAGDNDTGKNTGGMGSYAPTPFLTEDLKQETIAKIVEPTLNALQSEGIVYNGVLYCGLMLTPQGPKVVEFNCRFGDPETQVVLQLIESDLLDILYSCARSELISEIEFKDEHAVCVILASRGYPGAYEKGKTITGFSDVSKNTTLFHAGTLRSGGEYITNGGRVLAVSATAGNLADAIDEVYKNIPKILFDGVQFRTDIAKKALNI